MADKLADRIKAQEREIVELIIDGITFSNPNNLWYSKRLKEENRIVSRKYPIVDTTVEIQKPKKSFNTIIGEQLTTIEYNIMHARFPEYGSEGIRVRASLSMHYLFNPIDTIIFNYVHNGLTKRFNYTHSRENGNSSYTKEL